MDFNTSLVAFQLVEDSPLVFALILGTTWLLWQLVKKIYRWWAYRLRTCTRCEQESYIYQWRPLDQCPNRECLQFHPVRKSPLARLASCRKRRYKTSPGKRVRAQARR